ncbi:MAG: phosphatase PAP2 family protein [Prevotella sp.]|nr:phosphatase PAP2 family protein [Prevotella sp.]
MKKTNILKQLFEIEKKPVKGLMAYEWVVLGYLVLTLLLILFTYTKLQFPEEMIWGRLRIAAITIALWGVYRLIPCRLTRLVRVVVQMALLAWWYPDTYELNRLFPNLDHVFATWEQQFFGMQPALVLASQYPQAVVSELMCLGYASYYPLMAVVLLYYFFKRNNEFERAAYILLGAFFIYYVIFVFLPVAGPQYYYLAAGIDNIAKGVFPNVGDYFNTHQEALAVPGWKEGFFYHMVEDAHAAGERPTAAFPSSHVGITTVLLCLAAQTKSWRLTAFIIPFFVLMFAATVYIQAHYLIDAIAGIITGLLFYFLLLLTKRK